ncbi:arsenate reductase-like glutaredoxin family protein [Streptococcus pneumoniae]|uniref:arsenate reductase n=1 Tax=Streptococcus pneumoniae TaxID=1313 RepID=UPI0005E1CAD0|nr:arsenate reductase-like glutaredoxin family protein [Streptococcus pneumoniae]
MAERFWENLSIILAERNISWIELTRKMFAGEFHYPSELNRLYQKIREFLSPNLLRFKNRDNLKLTDFIEMILKNPELTIRLPLAVSNKRVYPNLNLEEARALLPRDTKQLIYMAQTHYLSN